MTAALANIGGVLLFCKGFTNTVLNEADPTVFQIFGLLMIMVWGVAYLGAAKYAPKSPTSPWPSRWKKPYTSCAGFVGCPTIRIHCRTYFKPTCSPIRQYLRHRGFLLHAPVRLGVLGLRRIQDATNSVRCAHSSRGTTAGTLFAQTTAGIAVCPHYGTRKAPPNLQWAPPEVWMSPHQ